MARPTVTVLFSSVDSDMPDNSSLSSDVGYPISFRYGFMSNKPNAPHVAVTGTAQFYFDNISSDLPYTEAASDGNIRGKGIGDRYGIHIDYDSDNLSTFKFVGKVTDWNVVPGLVEERITNIFLEDYIGDLSRYVLNGLVVQQSVNAADALDNVASANPFPTDVMPYSPAAYSYSTNGEVFTLVFHDIIDGQSKGIQAFSRVAESELGHVFCEAGTLYYVTNDDWINLGSSIGTLTNRYSIMEINKNQDLDYAPIFLHYYPASIADTDVVIGSYAIDLVLTPGASTTLRLNYRDPNEKATQVSAVDSDVLAPVDATDYIYSGVASTDLSITFTNKNSSGEYAITNNGSADVTFTTLQVRGKPVYLYDRATLVSTDGDQSAIPLELFMKYQDDRTFSEDVRDYLVDKYSTYPTENTVRSLSFVATADSDTMTLAMKGTLGKSVTIVEDINVINENYQITSVDWDILAPEFIIVTWGLYPASRWANYFLHDSDDTASYMTDSDSNRFAFWR